MAFQGFLKEPAVIHMSESKSVKKYVAQDCTDMVVECFPSVGYDVNS